MCSAPASAVDGLVDAYLDVSIGHSTVQHWNAEDINDGSVSNTKTQDTDAALRIALGYGVTRNFMIEFGHVDLGEATARGTSDGSMFLAGGWPAGPVRVTAEVVGYDLGAVVRAPLNEDLSVIGRAGVLMWTLKTSARSSAGSGSDDNGGSDLFYGLGAEFRISEWLSFRGDFTHHGAGDLDVNTVSISTILRMP